MIRNFCLIFVLSFVVGLIEAKECDGIFKIYQCQGQDLNMEKLNVAKISCEEELMAVTEKSKKDKKKSKDLKCEIKLCQWQKLNMITENESYNTEKASNFVNEYFPQDARIPIITELETCNTKKGKNLVFKKNNCKDSKKLLKCFKKGIRKVCKSSKSATTGSTVVSSSPGSETPIASTSPASTSKFSTSENPSSASVTNIRTSQSLIMSTNPASTQRTIAS